MKSIQLRLLAAALSFGNPVGAWSHDLSGQWDLAVENQKRHVVSALTVEFTDKSARSCMSGQWKLMKVTSVGTADSNFYPASDPLSYRVENGELTIGRNEICDAYLWLSGSINQDEIQGTYFSLGLAGRSPLGYFTLRRVSAAK